MGEFREAEIQIAHARKCGAIRHEERMRFADLIEQAVWEAKSDETADALVHLARAMLDPKT